MDVGAVAVVSEGLGLGMVVLTLCARSEGLDGRRMSGLTGQAGRSHRQRVKAATLQHR